MLQPRLQSAYRPFSHCINQAGLGAFTAKSGRKHYNPPPLTVMWMNFDSPNFPSFCSLSAIILFQTCSNKCILYVLSFHKCIKIKYKMVNMEYFVISAKFVPLKYYTLSSQLRRLTSFSVGCSGQRILSPGQIAVMRKWSIEKGSSPNVFRAYMMKIKITKYISCFMSFIDLFFVFF